jgi:DNA-binding transcriptional LysR family regulator
MAAIRQLRLYVRVAERLSVSQAAADLSVPQSTATRWLSDIEEEFGAKFLNRSTRRLSLTGAGSKFLQHAVLLIEQDKAIRDELLGSGSQKPGKLIVGAPTGFGTWVVLDSLSTFKQRNPLTTVELRLSEKFSDVVAEGLDVSIRIGALAENRLVARRLGALAEVLVCHADLAKGVDRDSPSAVERLPWVRLSALRHDTGVELRQRRASLRLRIEPWLWVDNVVALRQSLVLGAGASLIHRYAVESDLANGTLVPLLPEWELPKWPVHAIRAGGKPNPIADAFATHLKRVIQRQSTG